MALEPLTLWPQNEGFPIKVPFNPNTYSISKGVLWKPSTGADSAETDRKTNAPILTFAGGGARQLSFQLFFDVTEAAEDSKDVRDETDKIVKMTRIIRDLKRPPWVEVSWGGGGKEKRKDFPFTGVISELTQQFTLFHESGRPLRALFSLPVAGPSRNTR